jgi:hypothetical protein
MISSIWDIFIVIWIIVGCWLVISLHAALFFRTYRTNLIKVLLKNYRKIFWNALFTYLSCIILAIIYYLVVSLISFLLKI